MPEPLRYTEQDLKLALEAQAERLRARLRVWTVIVTEGDQNGTWERVAIIRRVIETTEGQVVYVD